MNNYALEISRRLKDIHQNESIPSDHFIDNLIGIAPDGHEEKLGINELIDQYGSDFRTYRADTTYSYIQKMFDHLKIFSPKSFLDIGCGNGRILSYGALLWEDVKFYGIELVKERAEYCNALKYNLNLHIEIINGDVLKEDLPPVECICLINSLFPSMMPPLLNKLKEYSQSNPFILVSASTCNAIIASQDWFQEVDLYPPPEHEYDLRIFKTV